MAFCKMFFQPFSRTQLQHNFCKHGQLHAFDINIPKLQRYDINVLLILPEPWISSAGRADLEHLSWFQCNMLFCTYCSSWWTNIQITSWDGGSRIIYVKVNTIMKTQSTFVLCEKFSWNQLTSTSYLDVFSINFSKTSKAVRQGTSVAQDLPVKKAFVPQNLQWFRARPGERMEAENHDVIITTIHSSKNDTLGKKSNFS